MSDDPTDADAVTARAGGQAKGGIDPQPGDPDTPLAARRRHQASDADHAHAGFGDDTGGDAV